MNPTDADAADGAEAAPQRDAPSVLIVVDNARRRDEMVELLQRIAPECRVFGYTDAVDALIQAAAMRFDLVVLDAALTLAAAPALQRHLARVAPDAETLVFDSAPGSSPSAEALDWTDARAACARWIVAWRARQRASDAAKPRGDP